MYKTCKVSMSSIYTNRACSCLAPPNINMYPTGVLFLSCQYVPQYHFNKLELWALLTAEVYYTAFVLHRPALTDMEIRFLEGSSRGLSLLNRSRLGLIFRWRLPWVSWHGPCLRALVSSTSLRPIEMEGHGKSCLSDPTADFSSSIIYVWVVGLRCRSWLQMAEYMIIYYTW